MNWFKRLSHKSFHIGTQGLTDEETINRIVLVNSISWMIGLAVIGIGIAICSVLHWPLDVTSVLALEFILNAYVIWLNHEKKYKSAALLLYYLQCACITFFGVRLVQLLHLEFVIILLIAIIYLIFKEKILRRMALASAILVLSILEYCYFKNGYTHLTTISYLWSFLINLFVVAVIIGITVLVSKPYVLSNDLRYELRRVNDFIKIFVAQLTHELRTPLDSIHHVTQLLRTEARKDEHLKNIRPLVDIAWSVSSNTRNIVNNVLDMAEIEAGKTSTIVTEAFKLAPFFERVLEVHKIIARREDMKVELHIAADMPEVIFSDPLIINQILTNLLANAFKYGAKQNTVRVDIKRQEYDWLLAVSNTGPGIPPEKMEVIFDPFFTGRTGHIQGTGLGLFIVKTKVKAMGGDIRVESGQDGITRFTVTLPLREGKLRDLPDMAGSDPDKADFHRAHILVAEDDRLTAFLFSRFLKDMGCSFSVVGNGQELLDMVDRKCPGDCPDIIILDCHMPVLGGEELIRRLREIPGLRHVPIIITTGDLYSDTIRKMLDAGANTFLKKPVDHLALQKTIGLYLQKLPQN